MLNDTPLVSVLMTSFNREKYIAEAIESVLASTYKNFELIIVDDASTDETVNIAKKFERLDQRIKVEVNPENLKQFGNRNKAASFAKGRWIKFFDSDDIMYPDCLQISVDAMQVYPHAAAGCEHKNLAPKLPVSYTPHELYINHYFKGNVLLFTGPTDCIFRKDVFDSLGGFKENVGILADTLLMLEIAALYSVVGFATGLTFYRIHDEQVTIGQQDWARMLRERFAINEIILNKSDCPLSKSEIAVANRNLKSLLIRNLLKFAVTKSFSAAYRVFKRTHLNYKDLLRAFTPNTKL